jgi:hypothetical protein
VSDPSGLRWETFFTFGEAATYGEDPALKGGKAEEAPAACCGTPASAAPACC